MPTITIPDDLYARLEQRAAQLGLTVEQLILPPLRHEASLVAPPPRPPLTPAEVAEREKALARLDRLAAEVARRLPPGFVADDSREAIYGLPKETGG